MLEKSGRNIRLGYVDALKGLAILLVIMGHVLSWQHLDWQSVLSNPNSNGMILWRIIYSFHMPLFMFCSGFVFFKEPEFYSLKNVVGLLKKRFVGLIFPYVFMGGLFYVLFDKLFVFWFLYVLFVFYCITVMINFIMMRFKFWQNKVGSITFMFISLVLLFLFPKMKPYEVLPFFDFSHFALYFYFCCGFVFRKHGVHLTLGKSDLGYTFAFLMFVFLTVNNTLRLIPNLPGMQLLMTMSAIVFVFCFFIKYYNTESKYFKNLENFGRMSLELYLLHSFFRLQLPFLGNIYESMSASSALTLQVITSLGEALVIIVICNVCTKLLSASSLCRKIFLGK